MTGVRRAWIGVALMLAAVPRTAFAVASCSASASPIAFGSYNPFNVSPTDSTGTITVSCSLGGLVSLAVSYTIRLSSGGSGSYVPRRMSFGANPLGYNLYTTSGRTTVWGDGTGGSATVGDAYLLGIGTTVRNYTVHGRVPALQNVRSGGYTDSVTVTVEY